MRRILPFLLLVTCSFSLAAERRPNVLFIAIDDLRAELNCYGASHVISPNLDKLAARGTLFENAYCQQAVCNPSRASALTGLRPDTLGIWDLPTHFRQKRPDITTLPQHFKNNGYHTEDIGKIFHNWRQDDHKGDAPSWSVPQLMHYNSHGNDKARVEGELPPDLSDIPKCVVRDVPDNAYFDGRVADAATAALERLQKSDKPFFLAVGFWKPHSHFNAPKKYWDLYDRENVTLAEHPKPPKDVPPIALHNGREICRSFKNSPGGIPTDDEARAIRHGYLANTTYMDTQLGKVVDKLDELGLAENTVIVAWSDHGFHLGENSLWAKTSNFELDARVPLIIATPDHKPAQRTSALAELLDLYPTLNNLCNLPAPAHKLEGQSLVPALENPATNIKPAAFTWHPRPAYPANGKNPDAIGYSLRTPTHRYTEWRSYPENQLLATELYDHTTDPDETVNAAAQNPTLTKSLSSLLIPRHTR